MAVYRIRLTLQGPLATPLHSGTLFGHLCWAKRYQDGEAELTRWLTEMPGNPLLISDAFPADCLPRPLLPFSGRPGPVPGESRHAFTERMQCLKKLRKTSWLSLRDFLDLRGGLSEPRLLRRLEEPDSPETDKVLQVRQAHNTIDRHTGTTPASGGLYFMDESWHDQRARELDAYVDGDMSTAKLQRLFDQVGEFGFGRDANLGRGRFTATVETAADEIFAYQGNRLISLSHGIISPNMAAPRYRLHTHYGKLGGLYAGGARVPFKHPLRLTQPGATFSPAGSGPYGQLLGDVHPHDPEIRHNAWHLCVPYTEALG